MVLTVFIMGSIPVRVTKEKQARKLISSLFLLYFTQNSALSKLFAVLFFVHLFVILYTCTHKNTQKWQ